MKPRRGLGRGLDALLAEDADFSETAPARTPSESSEPSAQNDSAARPSSDSEAEKSKGGGGVKMVAVADLRPGSHQPRRNFDEKELAELAESIRRRGILQPILARPSADGTGGGGGWEIVAGERRWRAARRAGLREVPVLVRGMSDREAMFSALVENLQRTDLNPLERARGVLRLVEDLGMTHAEAGAEVGLSRPAVTNILRLLELSPAVQRMMESGGLEAGHARALLGLGAEAQLAAARRIAAGGLSAREAERLAKRLSGRDGSDGGAGADGGGGGGRSDFGAGVVVAVEVADRDSPSQGGGGAVDDSLRLAGRAGPRPGAAAEVNFGDSGS